MKRDNVLTIFTRIQQRLHATARSIAGDDHADIAGCLLQTMDIK